MTINKYMVIIEYVKEQIKAKKFKPGSKLPSIRSMAKQFECSKNTIIHAYDNLEKDKVIYSVPKSGYYVLYDKFTEDKDGSDIINFSSNSPDPSALPYHDFNQCLYQAINKYQDKIFSYNEPNGLSSLRKALIQHLTTYQVFTTIQQVFVVSGAHQVFHFLNIMPFPNGKTTVLVEQPSFSKMLNSLELLGVTVIGITRTKDGIDMKELESHFRNNNVKFFYTVPRNHPSIATNYSMEQKKKITELAEKYDVYIVEDDYGADLEINKKSDPIYSLDTSDHTIYIKSFSKILSPGLRLAFVVLPKKLVETFSLYKVTIDRNTAVLSQGALEIFLSNGMYERHVSKVKKIYQKRLAELNKACNNYLPKELDIIIPKSGIYSILSLPKEIPAQKLMKILQHNNVLVDITEPAFLRTFPKTNDIRISILRTNFQQIELGVRKISEIIKGLL